MVGKKKEKEKVGRGHWLWSGQEDQQPYYSEPQYNGYIGQDHVKDYGRTKSLK